jgi:hypothetical protein
MSDVVDIDEWLLMRAQQFEDQHAPQNLTEGLRVASTVITTLRAEVERMRGALEQAKLYVERDEVAHGRQFGTGNAIRAALAEEAPCFSS